MFKYFAFLLIDFFFFFPSVQNCNDRKIWIYCGFPGIHTDSNIYILKKMNILNMTRLVLLWQHKKIKICLTTFGELTNVLTNAKWEKAKNLWRSVDLQKLEMFLGVVWKNFQAHRVKLDPMIEFVQLIQMGHHFTKKDSISPFRNKKVRMFRKLQEQQVILGQFYMDWDWNS